MKRFIRPSMSTAGVTANMLLQMRSYYRLLYYVVMFPALSYKEEMLMLRLAWELLIEGDTLLSPTFGPMGSETLKPIPYPAAN
jgi:hypothetical protein